MSTMFNRCSSLTGLDVSNFDTSKVTSMSNMFEGCSNLTDLDVSNFDTSNVTRMDGMFSTCIKVTNLDVSGFNTSKVVSMYSMFSGCSGLTSLDLRSFDTSSLDGKTYSNIRIASGVTVLGVDVNYMFDSCGNLRTIIFGDKFNRLDGYDMFRSCNKLKAIITTKTITTSSDAPTLSGTENVTNSNGEIIAGPNGLINLPNAILYVPDTTSEKLYEAATNYATTFADSRDTEGDLYRVRPILEVAGENPVKVKIGETYDATVDAGATIAGFGVTDSGEYTQYGYNYTTSGLPVDTTTKGTKQVTYTLTKTENGTTTNGMTTTRTVNVVGVPMLMERESFAYIAGKGYTYYAIGAKRSGNTKYTADLMSSITFVANKNVPSTAEASWDVSYTNGDNEVIAWVIPNTEDSTKYDLYIGFDNTIIQAPKVSKSLFGGYTNCTIINNLTMLDTSTVTDMSGIFASCSKLTSLDVSSFDTSKVTNMELMFCNCSNLTSLDVSSFDTSTVTDMVSMFYNCSNLTSLDVSNFNTSNVTNMREMFYFCSNLTSLDVSNFNTTNVTNMGSMFYNCRNLTSLDLSSFNTSNVTNMRDMFYFCSNLTSLDVSKFDTSNVTNMVSMFADCSKLTSLDVSKFDTSNVTNMSSMFYGCSKLTSLDVSNFNTTNVTNMSGMFSGCSKLTSLDVSGFDTSKVKTMGFMFNNCNSLKNIDLRSFDTSSLDGETYNRSSTALGVDVNYMFSYCDNLESIIIGDKFNRLDGYDMFSGCNKLKAIITTKTITTSSDAPTLSGTENVTNSNGKIIAGPNGLKNLPNAILYAPDTASEKLYEAATNYATTFADSRDTEGDLYRVRPILEVAGENPVKVKIGETYDATVDAGATIAGFTKAESSEYTQYGYNYTTAGLPLNTSAIGTKQVTYTLTKTENGTTTNGTTATRDVEVYKTDINDLEVKLGSEEETYIDSEIKPTVTVTSGNKTLTEGVDYKVSYKDNVDVGTATVTIEGIGEYEGTVEKTFTIVKRKITLKVKDVSKVYDGTALTSDEYEITAGELISGHVLTILTTGSQINVGTSTNTVSSVTIKNAANKDVTSNYDVTSLSGSLEVTEKGASDITAELGTTVYTYDGTAKEPTVTVKDGTKTLVAGTDYDVEYKDNINAGTATVTITLKGNYSGTITKTFTIERAKTATVTVSDKIYTGATQTGVVGTNVDLTGTTSATNVGTYTATAKPKTNYAWNDGTVTSKTLTWKITAKGMSDITASLSSTTYVYDGTAKEPTVTVKDGTKTLVEGTDYDVKYKDNVNAGTATVTITLRGNYEGTVEKTFTIERAKTATATASDKVYTGVAQTGVTGVNVDLVGTTSATNVGTYTATATPKTNYAWADGSTTSKTLTWKITEKASSDIVATLGETVYTYDGTAKEPTVTVKDGTKTLVEVTDYDVEYKDNINAGTATVTITLKGNYSGTIEKTFTIERAKTATATASDKVYTGVNQVGVIGTNVDLVGTTSATNVGTYTATATPKANYAWADGTIISKTLTWKITAKSGADITASLSSTTYVYDGTAKEPEVTVKDGTKVLVAGTDYDVEYRDNVNAGTATVTITLKGNYSGKITKTFTIERAKTATATASDKIYTGELQTGVTGVNVNLVGVLSATNVGTYTATATPRANYAWADGSTTSKTLTWKITAKSGADITASLSSTTYVYDGTAKEPTVTVKDGTKTLVAVTDYDVKYIDNVNAGTATVTITLKGNYEGTIEKTFTIERAKTATATASDKTYTGTEQIGVTGVNVDLTGTISATNVGTYTATATPKANYAWADGSTDAKTLTWKITEKASSDIVATLGETVYTYDGTAKEPTVTVKDGTKTLVEGTDYDVEYKDNVNAGTATVTITLKGNYSGTIEKTFIIERAKTATATASDKIYTGAAQTGVIGVNVDLTGTITATEVGTYTATATPKTNYAWADGTITSKTLTWKITAKTETDITAELGRTVYTYDGTAKEPTVTVKDGTKTLVAGTDYDVKYIDNVNAGTATVRITLKGNYSGTITKTFTIERAKTATATASDKVYTGANQVGVVGTNVDLTGTITATEVGTYIATATPKSNYAWADGTITSKTLTWKISAKSGNDITAELGTTVYTYDGTAKEPTVTVKDGTKTLVEGTDYDVEYKDNVNAGTATVTITLKGNYEGTVEKTFTIERAKTATATASDKVYTGVAQIGVTGVNVDLVGTTSATNVGTYTATATPKSNYAWADGSTTSKTLTWKITEKASSDIIVTLSETVYTYDGTAKEPEVTVKDGTKTLVEGTDYDVEYKDNVNAGTAIVTITLKGNYSGTIEKTFIIERAKTATATASDRVYTGLAQTGVTGVNVDLVGTTSATNVGTYTATATPKTNYAWADGTIISKTLTWKITAKSGADITASLSSTTYVYDGTAKESEVTVKDGTKVLVAGTDYDVEYKNNVNAGTATVTITLKGNYEGIITKNFTIERAKTATATASDKVYTGANQVGVIGTNVDLVGTTSGTNVGTYTATATPKANYAWADGSTTSKTLTWKITAKSGTDIAASLSSTTYVYDGTAKEPTVTVKDGTKTLVEGTDYDVEYKDNVNAGTATVTITLKGNYSGTIEKTFTIERAKTATATASDKTYTGTEQIGVTGVNVDLTGTISATNVGIYTATATPKANYAWADGTITSKTLTWKITEKASSDIVATLGTTVYTYDGTAKKPAVTVKDGTKTLVEGTDYDVEYKDNINAGTATVTITLKGNYNGTIIKNFTIERAKTATATASDKIYTGAAQTGVIGVNVDLTGTITATNVGTYTATATPKTNYAWADGTITSKTLTWKITAKSGADITASLSSTTYVYDGTPKEPTVTVKDGTKVLVAGTDYDVEYKNNVNAGTATVTITLKGNYEGTIEKTFTIERAKTATVTASDKVYTGSAQTGVIGVNVDLTGTITAINVGTYTATAIPKTNYAWSDGSIELKTLTWKITAKSGTDITAQLGTTVYTYDGTAKEPTVTVKDGETALVLGKDYDVEYKDNVNAGTATVTITLKGNYNGTKEKTFTIERAKTATATASDKTYTGTAQTGVTGVNVDLTGTITATAVGTYTATATPKANYAWADGSTDAKTLTWKITEKTSSDIVATLGETVYTYDGTAKEPEVTVKDGTKVLVAGTDYDVEYKDNVNAGTATVTITLKENYSGTITKNFTIERAKTATAIASDKVYTGSEQTGVTGTNVDLFGTISATDVGTYMVTAVPSENYAWSDGSIEQKILTWNIIAKDTMDITATLNPTVYTYDGTEKEPEVTVKDGTKVLVNVTDYDVEYSNNINAGTATVTITLKGNYGGTITKNFTIERAKTATATASDKIYTGELQTGVTGTHVNLIGMVEATNVGTYTVTATPKTNYAWADGSTDAKTLTWKITAKGLEDMTASLTPVSFEYDGIAKEPMAEVKDSENTLLNKTDYDVKYSNNINVGTAIATITFKGNYTGTLTREYTITARKITVKAKDVSKSYNGSALTSDVTEVVSGSLVEGHVITAQTTGSQIDVGTSTNVLNSVTISDALGNDVTENYDITTENGTLEVTANSSAKFDITLSNDSFEYDGTAKEPIATVKVDGKVLTEGVDYKVVYQDNVDAGTAKVIIEGIGNFEGSIGEKTFEITKANITGSVEIIGKNIFGETLTTNTNCNPSESTITYQWWYSSSSTATSGTLIPNATNKDYRIGDDLAAGTLIGKYIGVTVKFSNGNNYNEKTAYDITTSDDNENATTKKADRTIELIDSKSVIRGTTTDVSFTYTGEASSTSVTSSAADKATATVTDSGNGGTIKVTAVGVGTANITLTVAESQDYNAVSKICVISIKSDNSNLMVRELGEYEAGTGTIYYVIGAQRAGKKQYKADLIKTITFVQGNEVPANAVDSWDVSFNNGDYNVRAWVIKNSSDNSMYDLYIGADSKIVAPSISDRMFRAYTNCISINGLEFLDTSKATSMNYMFMDSDSLTTLDLSYFDTSKVTGMMYMFSGCKALKNVDLSSFDTTNVTTMTAMFGYCENMTDVTFGNSFKTNKVTDISYMFSRCSKLTKIDLSKFDTSSATNMEQMFAHCNSVKELQLQQFNTNKVTTMSSMFNDCSSLTKLDLSSFNTNNVTDMSGLFGGCVNLETITLGKNFETSNVEDMSSMFSECAKLSNLNVSEFNTSKVTNMSNMFKGCNSITALDISNFDTSKVTNMHSMFENCGNLRAIHLGEMFDTSKVTDMKYMFSGNSKLTAIITRRTINSVDNAIKFSTDTGLNNLYDAILYVPNEESEKLYEKSENYSTIFGHAKDTIDDLYRVRPILELIGENPLSVSLGKTYNESTDSGVTIAGFDKDNASGYTQFGYNYMVTGLPVDTSKEDTKEVVYTLTYTRPGTTTTISEMKVVRTVEVVGKNIGALEANLPQNSYEYTGFKITPEPTVKDGNVILEKGVDYELTYGNNIDVGYGTVTITGKGLYTGSKTLTFEITLAKMTGRVVIKGINKVGNVLTVDTSKIVPTGCTLTYQWYFSNDATMINGTAIDGETTDKYTLKDSNIGKYIYVEVIASKKNYETHKFTDVTDASNNNYDMVVGNVDRKPTIRFEEKQVSTDSVEITIIIKTVSGVTRVTVNNSVIDKSRYQNSITKTNYEITTTFKYTALVNGVFVFEVEDEIGNITKETLNISTIGTSAPKITYKKYNATYYDKAKIIFESDTLVKIFAPESYVADGITFSTNYYSTKIVATIAEGTTFDEDKTFTFINEKSDVIGVTVEAPIYTKNVYIRMAKEATNPLNITIKEACMLAENMTNSKALIGAKVDSYYGIKGTTKVNVATGKELDVAEKLGSSTKTMSYNTKGGLDETPTTSLTTGTSGNYMNNNITGIYVKTSGLLDVLTLITSSLEKYTTFRITIRP